LRRLREGEREREREGHSIRLEMAGKGGKPVGRVGISVRNSSLDRARALLGVSKGDFDKELDAHRTGNERQTLMPLLERPGLGAEQLKRQKEPVHATEGKLLRSIQNNRLKRARDARDRRIDQAKGFSLDAQDSDSEEEELSKAETFSKSRKKR